MPSLSYYSWGHTQKCEPSESYIPESRFSDLVSTSQNLLSIGNLRSYGDSCYNDDGCIIDNENLTKFIDFDRENGYLTADAGVSFEAILNLIVSCGWFIPVTPGTKFVTLGGAIANDVHGKNHHKDGSFGCFVSEFELVRSDRSRQTCSRELNSELFFATIGGLGLTGWITWLRIKLVKVQNPYIITNSYKFSNLHGFFELNNRLEEQNTYTVSWVDCSAKGKQLGRGVYYTGEHAGISDNLPIPKKSNRSMPVTPPFSLINTLSLKAFNCAYYNRATHDQRKTQHYEPFFYPLDGLLNWNRIYGKKGFYQYQCVVPKADAEIAIGEMLQQISRTGLGSFLAVLKTFGNKASGGLMSFPREGVTLALDFANCSDTIKLFKSLDEVVFAANGALYPAKDGRMSPKMFEHSFPNINQFEKYIDPKFSSNLWRRVRN